MGLKLCDKNECLGDFQVKSAYLIFRDKNERLEFPGERHLFGLEEDAS